MKHTFKICTLLICMLYSSFGFSQEWYDMILQEPVNVEKVEQSAEKYFDNVGRGKHTGYKQYQRWLYGATLNMDENGNLYTSEYMERELKIFRSNTSNRQQRIAADDDANGNWSQVVPYLGSDNYADKSTGRITAIAVEPINQQLMFAGSSGGGIWKSEDAGASWIPLGDQLDDMEVHGIGLDPHDLNHVLFFTRECDLYETFDQGLTWNRIVNHNFNIGNNRAIKFHPTIPNTYFFASMYLTKTTDGGATFTNVINEPIEDIYFKPGDNTTMYASGTNFWKSTDSGETWTQITNGMSISYRMKIAVNEANPNIVYVVQAQGGGFGRIYKSTDSGDSFTVMSDIDDGAYDVITSMSYRVMAIMCPSSDPDEIYVAGVKCHVSNDGGATFERYGSDASSDPKHFHSDVEILMNINGTLYAGTDGGFFRSTDGGDSFVPLAGNGLMVAQYTRIATSAPYPGTGGNVDPNVIMGGLQDNGTQIGRGANYAWEKLRGGDGGDCIIDYTDDNNIIISTQNGLFFRKKEGNSYWSLLNRPEEDGAWVTPIVIDAKSASTLYVGYKDLYMSTDFGDNWEMISSGQTEESIIDVIAIAPSDNNYMFFADYKRLWVTTNAQSSTPTWREITDFNAVISDIEFDLDDPLHALVSTSGSNIYETKDAGLTWNEISGNLPGMNINCLLMDNSDENRIYVGLSAAIYYKDDNMTDWEVFGKELSKCTVRDLDINYQSNKLFAATYGRGIWEIPIFGTGIHVSPEIVAETDEKCSGDSIQLSVEENQTWAEPISYQWYKNGVSISEAINTTYYALEAGDYYVKVTANEVSGTSSNVSLTFLDTPDAPVVSDEEICETGNVTFTATAFGNGSLKWYSSLQSTNELAEGNTFSVDVSATSTYYVKETSTAVLVKGGMEEKSDLNGTYHIGGPHLIIDVESAFILRSAKVYAEEAGERTFELRNSAEELILSKSIYVEAGESRVYLDFDIPVGDNLTIGTEEDALHLHRSKGTIAYPFEEEGIVTIKNSTNGSQYYYTLYDWEIQTGSASLCPSPSSAVTVLVDNCVGLSTYTSEDLILFPNPTSGLVNLKLPQDFQLHSIELTDITGKSLLTYDKYIEQIDLQRFKSGIYMVKVMGEQGTKVFKIEVK